ncbi:hypothetical protein [Actinophytocola oryzae]|uniref:Uncharacterized protein n=1 Tax=Actinophytocola oryzae TaxID=502181 RepID=A0A4R7VV18_9PSEU|nr:hypothetical protein [Actinophytocola oryzae]TDV53846.1 hypothetical protein CLV71_104314 [Actinophytocola oryzae]
MTDGEKAKTENTAEAYATVGIQAQHVHNSNVYQVLPDTPPHKKYEIGVHYLTDGVPGKARDLIADAIAGGFEDGEVRFHWVLAMLSKRAYRDLPAGDREQLNQLPHFLHRYSESAWKQALVAIDELLKRLHSTGAEPGPALEAISALPLEQRELIDRHLDLMLTGSAKDKRWADTRAAAKKEQHRGNRVNRAWAYFEPDPIEARARKPAEVSTTPSDLVWVIASTVPFLVSAAYLGWIVLASATPMPVVAYVLALGAEGVCFLSGLAWSYRERQLRARERTHSGRRGAEPSSDAWFAHLVHQRITYHFALAAAEKSDIKGWLAATKGIRAALRDEIVELYGESRISVGRVEWLIKYLVGDLIRRWKADTLREYRKQWRVPTVTKLSLVLSVTVLVPAVVEVAVTAADVDPVRGTAAVFVLLVCGRAAVAGWSGVLLERRRFADDSMEYNLVLDARVAEHERWRRKIEKNLPNESEMERWLNSDKTMLLDKALRYHKLAWRDVIVHAVLQTPGRSYRRARTSGLPWRYSRYDMRLFLITQDGVREYRAECDFERVRTTRTERHNFRFDAVSSVGVVTTDDLSYRLKLILTNGKAQKIRVTDVARPEPDVDENAPDVDENPEAFSELNLDAAGFLPTLHILEGIAAEGKGWLQRDADGRGRPPVPEEVRDFDPVPELLLPSRT